MTVTLETRSRSLSKGWKAYSREQKSVAAEWWHRASQLGANPHFAEPITSFDPRKDAGFIAKLGALFMGGLMAGGTVASVLLLPFLIWIGF